MMDDNYDFDDNCEVISIPEGIGIQSDELRSSEYFTGMHDDGRYFVILPSAETGYEQIVSHPVGSVVKITKSYDDSGWVGSMDKHSGKSGKIIQVFHRELQVGHRVDTRRVYIYTIQTEDGETWNYQACSVEPAFLPVVLEKIDADGLIELNSII